MKYLKLHTLVFALCLLSCNSAEKHKATKTTAHTIKKKELSEQGAKVDYGYSEEDKEEIQILIRHVLSWGESKPSFDLIPELTDSKDSLCIGFNLFKVKTNLDILKATGYFSAEFIDNYNQILLTLDKEMKAKQFKPWSTGELPPFNFANDVDPWTDCQDVPYDEPDAYGLVEVYVVNLNKEEGELYWKWGKLGADVDPSWKKFTYKFKVKKEDGRWKVSYLEGFDFKESVSFFHEDKKNKSPLALAAWGLST
jgi:hypothetical protein